MAVENREKNQVRKTCVRADRYFSHRDSYVICDDSVIVCIMNVHHGINKICDNVDHKNMVKRRFCSL